MAADSVLHKEDFIDKLDLISYEVTCSGKESNRLPLGPANAILLYNIRSNTEKFRHFFLSFIAELPHSTNSRHCDKLAMQTSRPFEISIM